MLRVAFRVDAFASLGHGHLSRCLTLADALSPLGVEVGFVMRDRSAETAPKIEGRGHGVVLLPTPPEEDRSGRLGVSRETDAAQTIEALAGEGVHAIVVDHYELDARWETRVRDATGAVLGVIDGMADRPHDCELLVDPTFSTDGRRRWDGLVPERATRLTGPRHALLAPSFSEARSRLAPRTGVVRRILVCFGGSDPAGATEFVIEALRDLEIPLDVVVGGANSRAESIRRRCEEIPEATCRIDTTDHVL